MRGDWPGRTQAAIGACSAAGATQWTAHPRQGDAEAEPAPTLPPAAASSGDGRPRTRDAAVLFGVSLAVTVSSSSTMAEKDSFRAALASGVGLAGAPPVTAGDAPTLHTWAWEVVVDLPTYLRSKCYTYTEDQVQPKGRWWPCL